MTPKWQKLAGLALKICILWFQFFSAVFASKGYPFKNIFVITLKVPLWPVRYDIFLYAFNNGADQTAQMGRLLCLLLFANPRSWKTGLLTSWPTFTNELVSTGDSASFTLQTQSNEQEWLRNYEHCHMSDYIRLHNGQKVAFYLQLLKHLFC